MAEFPNKSVTERYKWYDKYLGVYMAQGKDVSTIYQKLKPLIKDLPGK